VRSSLERLGALRNELGFDFLLLLLLNEGWKKAVKGSSPYTFI